MFVQLLTKCSQRFSAQREILDNLLKLKNADRKIIANTTDAADTFAITLADYGISPTGLLAVSSWVHTTDGSVITVEANTVAVSSGVATITIAAGTDNDSRIVEIVGTAVAGVFA